MSYTVIDLSAITLPELELFGTLFWKRANAPAPTLERIRTDTSHFLLAVEQEAATLDRTGNADATITLSRHFQMMREACIGLCTKIGAYDARHIDVLFAAATLLRSSAGDTPLKALEIYTRLTTPFPLAPEETFADVVQRPAPPMDPERFRYLAITDEEAAALNRFRAEPSTPH